MNEKGRVRARQREGDGRRAREPNVLSLSPSFVGVEDSGRKKRKKKTPTSVTYPIMMLTLSPRRDEVYCASPDSRSLWCEIKTTARLCGEEVRGKDKNNWSGGGGEVVNNKKKKNPRYGA